MSSDPWALLLIGGPILLFAVAMWAWLRNRSAKDRTEARAERGAVELREDIESGRPPPHS